MALPRAAGSGRSDLMLKRKERLGPSQAAAFCVLASLPTRMLVQTWPTSPATAASFCCSCSSSLTSIMPCLSRPLACDRYALLWRLRHGLGCREIWGGNAGYRPSHASTRAWEKRRTKDVEGEGHERVRAMLISRPPECRIGSAKDAARLPVACIRREWSGGGLVVQAQLDVANIE